MQNFPFIIKVFLKNTFWLRGLSNVLFSAAFGFRFFWWDIYYLKMQFLHIINKLLYTAAGLILSNKADYDVQKVYKLQTNWLNFKD